MPPIFFSPGPSLKSYIESYTWYAATEPAHQYYIPASAYAHISLIPAGRVVLRSLKDSQMLAAGTSFVLGPTDQAWALHYPEVCEILCIRFKSALLYPLFGVPAQLLTNQLVYLADLGGEYASLTEKVWETNSMEARIGSLEHWLVQKISQYLTLAVANPPFIHTLIGYDLSKQKPQFHYSERHLRRLFQTYSGFSPKTYDRVQRFRQTLSLLQQHSRYQAINWAQLADSCGFSDQAHMIREFQCMASFTPCSLYATSKKDSDSSFHSFDFASLSLAGLVA